MRRLLPTVVAFTATFAAAPLNAQENLVTLGAFVTVRAENVPEFEEAAQEHAQWHADQNDPQPWPAYQALTGRGEYAFLAPDMSWASLDAPALSMADDVAHWSESAAPYTETEEFVMWTNLPGGSPPADATQFPVVQVFEFEIRPGGQAAAMDAIERISEALAEVDFHWQWSTVISADGPPTVFIALWADSFASLGAPGPGPAQILTDAFGPERSAMIMRGFAEVTMSRSSQIWVMRPDMSHVPG